MNTIPHITKAQAQAVRSRNMLLVWIQRILAGLVITLVVLVDDQRLMCEGLHTLLELEGGFEIVGEAANGQAALDAYAEVKPDVE